nr:methyl-accepting chemotaxis protein [Paenibacillus soyae]
MLRSFLQGAVIGIFAVLITNAATGTPLFSLPSLLCIVLVGLGTTVFGFFNFKAYATPFAEIEGFITTIAQGDLTKDINMKNLGPLARFGPSMNSMRQSLHELVSTAKETSEQVNRSIGVVTKQLDRTRDDYNQIMFSVREVSSAIRIQSQSAAESSKGVDEMAVGVGEIAESSIAVGASSNNAAAVAARTREDIAFMNNQMNRVQEAFSQLSATIQEFVHISGHIGGSIQLITEISGQTNLLALNASIEAARAGEHGRGFAVVASEVRKLAAQASESATSIQELVSKMADNSKDAMDAMTQSEREVESGLQVVRATESSMFDILNTVETINQQINNISYVGEQLAAGSEQIAATVDEMAKTAEISNESVQEIVQLTGSVQSAMDEVTEATSRLKELGGSLQDLMNRFTI